MNKRVVSIGEMLAQYIVRPGAESENIGFGGDTLAVASAAALISRKYGLGVTADYYTALGLKGDTGSDAAIAFMNAQGVGNGLVKRILGRTIGIFVINYNEHEEMVPDPVTGERYIFDRLTLAATQMISPDTDERIVQSLANDFDYMYISQISVAVLRHRP